MIVLADNGAVSNHFTGLSLGPPLGDQRLDLCDLYAFQSPADPTRTVIILNANPNADNAPETVLPGAMVPVMLADDAAQAQFFCAQLLRDAKF